MRTQRARERKAERPKGRSGERVVRVCVYECGLALCVQGMLRERIGDDEEQQRREATNWPLSQAVSCCSEVCVV